MPALSTAFQSEEPSDRKPVYNVLFLCADNSPASIFAKALLTRWGEGVFRAFSAQITKGGLIDSVAIEVLKGYNVWKDGLRSRNCDEFLGPDAPVMDFVFTLGANRPLGMPSRWPGSPQVIHWRITDPVVARKPEERNASYKAALRELETRIKLFTLVYKREVTKFARAA